MNIDLKLAWEVGVTLLGLVGTIFSAVLFWYRKEGVTEEQSKQLQEALKKFGGDLKKLTEDQARDAIRDSSIESSLIGYSERLVKNEGAVRSHDMAISALREEVAKLPTREEMRMLHSELSGVRSSIGEISGQLRGVSRSLDLINEHLLSRGAG